MFMMMMKGLFYSKWTETSFSDRPS